MQTEAENEGQEAKVAPSTPPSTLRPPLPPSAVAWYAAPETAAKSTVSGESGRKWPPRWPVTAVTTTGITIVAIIFGVVLSKWSVIRGAHEEAEAQAREAGSSRVSTLVPDPASDPAISPDGKLVAYRRNSYTPGGAGIFLTSSESKAAMQLTQHPGDCCPAWSPDGKQIAFTRIATDEYAIYVVSARGGAPRKISHEDPRKKRGELAWTPDGKYIAFSGDSPQGGSQIFVVSLEDSSVQAITEPQGQDRDWGPAFSPDGQQMAFVRGNGAGFPEEIWVIPVSGTLPKVEFKQADGKGTDRAIVTMPMRGGLPRQLTNERSAIMGPPTLVARQSERYFFVDQGRRSGAMDDCGGWRGCDAATRNGNGDVASGGSAAGRADGCAEDFAIVGRVPSHVGSRSWKECADRSDRDQRQELRTASFAGWASAGVHVRPFGLPGNLGEQP